MVWLFMGKSTGNQPDFPWNMGCSCNFSLTPINWYIVLNPWFNDDLPMFHWIAGQFKDRSPTWAVLNPLNRFIFRRFYPTYGDYKNPMGNPFLFPVEFMEWLGRILSFHTARASPSLVPAVPQKGAPNASKTVEDNGAAPCWLGMRSRIREDKLRLSSADPQRLSEGDRSLAM